MRRKTVLPMSLATVLRLRLTAPLIVSWAVLLAPGCGGSGSSGGAEALDSAQARKHYEPPPIHGDTVEVVLDDYIIQMPDTIPPGTMVFHVRNAGFEGHNIEILEGDSSLFRFPFSLNPYEEKTAPVTLAPGRYRVICPESTHATKGMDVPLVVSGRPDEE